MTEVGWKVASIVSEKWSNISSGSVPLVIINSNESSIGSVSSSMMLVVEIASILRKKLFAMSDTV